MYDGTSDPFDHLLHHRQLMTLDIVNDVLLYKVFPTNLHGSTFSWFHQLLKTPSIHFAIFLRHFSTTTYVLYAKTEYKHIAKY